MNQKLLIKDIAIYAEHAFIERGSVLVEHGKIQAIITDQQAIHDATVVTAPKGAKLLPGMIDLHIHGAMGFDVMDATTEAISNIAQHLPSTGTTSFLATTMTMSKAHIEAALKNVASYRANPAIEAAEVLGVHLEGPFISRERLGAHRAEHACEPDIKLIEHWQAIAKQVIKLVTLAPELSDSISFIRFLTEQGIVPSLGHTNASSKQAVSAIQAGCCHATHLFNAMSGLDHREPGVAAAVLQSQEVLAELIVDGIHVAPEMIHIALQAKGKEGLCLVTDAIRAQCLGDGRYDLGGQEVIVSENQARLSDHTLAGSVLTMQQAVKNMMRFTDCSLRDVIALVSENPAKQLNIFDRKGSIAVGKDADLIILSHEDEHMHTFCLGNPVFSAA